MNRFRMSAPLSIQLSMTHSCNHRCIHCYNPDRPAPVCEKFDFKTKIPKLIDEISKNKVMEACITGGEPLTDKNLTALMVKSLIDAGLETTLNTNLTLMDQKFIDILGNHIPHVFTSLPSLRKDSCDDITCVEGSYERILKGISICGDNGIKVGVNVVYTKYSDCTLELIEDLIGKYDNIYRVSISPVVPPEYDQHNKRFILTNDDLIKIRDMLLAIHDEHGIAIGCSTPLPVCIVGNELLRTGMVSSCSGGISDCSVDVPTGDVMACFQHGHVYGNIYDDGLSKCWNNMEEWNSDSMLNEECRDCSCADLCSGECRVLTMQGNSFHLDRNAAERIEEPEISPADANHRFRISNSMKMREDCGGYLLASEGEYLFMPPSLVPLADYLVEKKEFSIPEIKDDVEINDMLLKVLGMMVSKKALIDLGPL